MSKNNYYNIPNESYPPKNKEKPQISLSRNRNQSLTSKNIESKTLQNIRRTSYKKNIPTKNVKHKNPSLNSSKNETRMHLFDKKGTAITQENSKTLEEMLNDKIGSIKSEIVDTLNTRENSIVSEIRSLKDEMKKLVKILKGFLGLSESTDEIMIKEDVSNKINVKVDEPKIIKYNEADFEKIKTKGDYRNQRKDRGNIQNNTKYKENISKKIIDKEDAPYKISKKGSKINI